MTLKCKQMKKIFQLLIILGMFLSFTSCEEEEEVVYVSFLPGIVVDIIGDAIEEQTLGIDYVTLQASSLVNESLENPQPTYTYNTSVSNTWLNGWNSYQYSYNAVSVAEGIEFDSSSDGEYETYLMTSDDEIENDWLLSNISSESDYYNISGETVREGMQYSKAYKDSFESTIHLTFENITVNRVTGYIKEGTITYTYEGVSSYGETYSNQGEIRYSDYTSVIDPQD